MSGASARGTDHGTAPAQIGRYVVENLVGTGGMGQIFKAHDPDIRRTVAIKLISTG